MNTMEYTKESSQKDLDWANLGFKYIPTNCFAQVEYKDGKWGVPTLVEDPCLKLHMAANVLHYGQACFEGLKAFETKSGQVALFRPDENAIRLQKSADRICMEAPSQELFLETCLKAIEANREFVPPYGTGASLYIRPTLIGTEPMVGVNPSDSYTFFVFVIPVGPYYKDGFSPVRSVILDQFDRAAAMGTGRAKAAGNYAASLMPHKEAKKQGFPIVLYTDSIHHKYIDEFGTSNFIGITKDRKYVTPDSPSVLKSITNKSLQVLAEDQGYTVCKQPILVEEVNQFCEVGACGTAAVITPIHSITRGDQEWTFGDPNKAGNVLTSLYEQLQGIQYGEIEDKHNWLTYLP
jgi:branched-chain amino acid aminotransferase